MPSDEDQIRALLSNTEHDLVRTILGKEQLEPGDYAKVITVSFDAVVEDLLSNCSINDIANTKESVKDGYYALPGKGCWTVYYQERATDSGRDILYSEKDIFSDYTKTVLRIDPNGRP